jgi:protein-tyrosine phosphatase
VRCADTDVRPPTDPRHLFSNRPPRSDHVLLGPPAIVRNQRGVTNALREPSVTNSSAVPNLRDLGGLPTESGRRTRNHVLLRSAAPLPGDQDPEHVPWPPAGVIDLRATAELSGKPHPLEERGTRVHSLPMPRVTSNWSESPDLASVYPRFLTNAAQLVVTAMRIVTEASGPVLVHCSMGKDRTGIVVAVLLRAAGVTKEAVIADYTRSACHLDAVLARTADHGPEDPGHRELLLGSPPAAIQTILDELDRAGSDVGDPHGAWLIRNGATERDIRTWRDRLVD